MSIRHVFILIFISCTGCSFQSPFWARLVNSNVEKPLSKRETGTEDAPRLISPHNIKVVYNDGKQSTEVLVPILSSGQRVVIDHRNQAVPTDLRLSPLPPTAADKGLEDAYSKEGKAINRKGKPVSILASHEKIKSLADSGNYELALQYAEQVLERYPNHVQTLRAKGSLLLKIGELKASLEAYSKSQELEFDKRVADQIKKIEKMMGE
ncbi:MAG: hypothetical protein KA436_07000 [Oligoflexales bacterium]|nr:hypothetical protein [Oligoflexales bacterium]